MAADMVALMRELGHERFAIAGHDRGGRVAYRAALDSPQRITHLAVLDVVPIVEAFERADARFALAFWPWALLSQPAPFPEAVLMKNADAIVDHALAEWGSEAAAFGARERALYAAPLRDAAHAHSICEEFRAAAGIDRDQDAADHAAGRRIVCPTLVLWAQGGPLDQWYEHAGGPVAVWKGWADHVQGEALPGGHFFAEANAVETAQRLLAFCSG